MAKRKPTKHERLGEEAPLPDLNLPHEFQWIFDAPTGTYRNPGLDRCFENYILGKTVVYPHAKFIDRLGCKAHDTVTITKLTVGSPQDVVPLVECQPVPEDENVKLTQTTLEVKEYGRATPYRSLTEDFHRFDPENPVQGRMLEQGILIRDAVAVTSLRQTPVKFIPLEFLDDRYTLSGYLREDGTTTVKAWTGWRERISLRLGLDNRRPLKASRVASWQDFQKLSERMCEVYRTPTIDGSYIAFIGANVARTLKRTMPFEAFWRYDEGKNVETVYTNEIGRVASEHEGQPAVRFVVVYSHHVLKPDEAIIVGDDAFAVVEAEPLHLRAAVPSDFGRSKFAALYGLLACGLIFPSAKPGECRVVHITEGEDIPPFGVQLRANLRRRWTGFTSRATEKVRVKVRVPIAAAIYRLGDWINGGPQFEEEYE